MWIQRIRFLALPTGVKVQRLDPSGAVHVNADPLWLAFDEDAVASPAVPGTGKH